MSTKRPRQAFESDITHGGSNFVLYGTPLPSSDHQARDDGSYIPVWQQEVTDERGRKRLHGAFTGGFSAGYFNTVGSKEGWTPSTFVSSRTNRSQKTAQQKAEDFMDDEDIRETEESRNLSASNEFKGFGTVDDAAHKSTAADLFVPRQSSIGVKLLQQMGWKQGQGIGPRVRRAARFGDGAGISSDDNVEKHLFAPDDPPMVSFVRKLDSKGVGYGGEVSPSLRLTRNNSSDMGQNLRSADGEDEGNVLRDRLGGSGIQNRSSGVRRSGFGVGILNDTGSDDEDPYAMGPKIALGRGLGREKKAKTRKPAVLPTANPPLSEKPVYLAKKLSALKGGLRKCRDGRLPIDGFVLADEVDSLATMSLQDERFKPPEVPPDWTSSLSQAGNNAAMGSAPSGQGMKSAALDMKARASLLGESQLPGKSVFDFMGSAARERLAKASGVAIPSSAFQVTPQNDASTSKSSGKSLRDLVPDLDPAVASQALDHGVKGWMPYAEDEQKQKRYRAFLEISREEARTELPSRAPGSTLDEWSIEMREFARAAHVFKPVSGLMASRFTSSKSTSTAQPTSEDGTEKLISRPKAKSEDPAEAAAKMGMFGSMTRSETSFYPTRILCKRFNVPMPDNSDKASAAHTYDQNRKQDFSASYPPDTAAMSSRDLSFPDTVTAPVASSGSTQDLSIHPEHNEAIETSRPGKAVFKAIFGSDDEDE